MKQRYEIQLANGEVIYIWARSIEDAKAITYVLDTCPINITLDHVMQEN